MFKRRGMRRRRKPVKWVETKDSLVQSAKLFGAGGGNSSASTWFYPLFTNENQPADRADLPFDFTTSEVLGVSDWGTAVGQLYEPGFKLERVVGELQFTIQQRKESAGASPAQGAQNVVVRCGIVIMEVDESGNALNTADYPLHKEGDWKDRRWLWFREWWLHNKYSGLTVTNGGLYFADDVAAAAVDQPRVVWGPTSTVFYPYATGGHLDLKARVPIGKGQRLFYAFSCWDPAQGPQDISSMATSWTLVWEKRARGLWSKSTRRAQKT